MRRIGIMLLAGIGIFVMLAASPPASAASRGCTFKKTVRQGDVAFDISSHPADGCAIQIVEVIARKGGKRLARLKADVDFLAEAAWGADLTGEGKPAVVVASRSVKSGGRGTIDVYWLEGDLLRRAAMPQHREGAGYKGRDTFRVVERKIVRNFPVYLDGDPENRPNGGTRTVQYMFGAGKLYQSDISDGVASISSPGAKPAYPKSSSRILLEGEGYPLAAPPGFFPAEDSQPIARPRSKTIIKQLPETGYPRAAPPGFFPPEASQSDN